MTKEQCYLIILDVVSAETDEMKVASDVKLILKNEYHPYVSILQFKRGRPMRNDDTKKLCYFIILEVGSAETDEVRVESDVSRILEKKYSEVNILELRRVRPRRDDDD